MNRSKFKPFFGLNSRALDEADSLWSKFANLRRRLSRFLILILSLLLLLAGSLLSIRSSVIGLLAVLCWSALLFLYGRTLANGIEIRRVAPFKGREEDNLEVTYLVTNHSPLGTPGFYIFDFFGGTKTGSIYLEEVKPLSGRLRRRVKTEVKLNHGSGRFKFGPTLLVVTDPMGLFTFVVEENEMHEIDVYPLAKEILPIKLLGTKYSESFGIYDQLNPGNSISFMGIRPYNTGDPLKYISWKISAKSQELMVKIFDNSISDDVTIMLNFSPKSQMGAGTNSTWQLMKDLSLSLTRQCLDYGNRVQVISQNLFVPWGRGDDFWTDSIMKVGTHLPAFLSNEKEESFSFDSYVELLPIGSTVFLLQTYTLQVSIDTYETVRKLRARHIDVYVFLVDTFSFIRGPYATMMWGHLGTHAEQREKSLKIAQSYLISIGARVVIIEGKDRINESILSGLEG